MDKQYKQWIETEKMLSEEAYKRYRHTGRKVRLIPSVYSFTVRAAAAVLILALGTGIWMKRDTFFRPHYSKEQIAESYHETLKVLSLYSQSLSQSFDRLKDISLVVEEEGEAPLTIPNRSH